jgi:hypothetical protein
MTQERSSVLGNLKTGEAAVTTLVVTAAAAGLWYLFRPEKLFVNRRMNEAAPFSTGTSP